MGDREKVIKGLECCTDGMMCKRERCPYYGKSSVNSTCRIELEKDAIALLKAQEPVEPVYGLGITRCGQCNHEIDKYGGDNYCPQCGRAVKWE